jgi:hypothetical protein
MIDASTQATNGRAPTLPSDNRVVIRPLCPASDNSASIVFAAYGGREIGHPDARRFAVDDSGPMGSNQRIILRLGKACCSSLAPASVI